MKSTQSETFWIGQADKLQWNEIKWKKIFLQKLSNKLQSSCCPYNVWVTVLMNFCVQQVSPPLGKKQPKTSDCSFQEAAINNTTLDTYSLLFSHQRLQGGNLTIYISTFPKASVQSTALVFTGLIWTQDPTIALKLIPRMNSIWLCKKTTYTSWQNP